MRVVEAPLTASQMQAWLLDRVLGGELPLVVGAALYDVDVDVPVLRACLDAVAGRHEALRTTVVTVRGRPMLRLDGHASARAVDNLGTLDGADDVDDIALQLWLCEHRATFGTVDLASGPPWRASLVRLGAGGHALVVTAHPIVADARSLTVILDEVRALYDAALGGPRADLPRAVAYRDHVAGVGSGPGTAYWGKRLTAAVALAGERRRGGLSATASETVALRVAREGTGLGAELQPLLTAVVATAFARRRHQGASVVGVALDTRRAAPQAIVGPCTTWLPIVVDADPSQPVRALVAEVGESITSAVDHTPLPVEDLVAGSPLPAVALGVAVGVGPARRLAQLDGLTDEAEPVWRGRALAGHTLLAQPAEGGLLLGLEYRLDVEDRASARHRLEGLAEAVAAAADAIDGDGPALRVRDLPLVGRRQRRLLVASGTGPRRRYATDDVAELVERVIQRQPGAAAVVEDRGRTMTYAELGRASDAVAAFLRRDGVGEDDVVGVLVPRSADLVATLLGILKAGAAFLPLDPDEPANRREYMVRDAGVRRVLTTRRVGDPGDALDGGARSGNPPDRLAYVLYTSGSTGTPKGVLVEHGALANQLHWQQEAMPLAPGDRVAYRCSVAFDPSLSEVFGTLAGGATIVAAAPGRERDVAYLLDLVARHGVTSLGVTPALLDAMLAHRHFDGLPGVRRIASGGEELRPATARRCLDATSAELVNLYGPTETTINATFHRLDRDAPLDVVPIGRPVANTEARVLGPRLEPVPIGVVGEVCIGGAQVARGYSAADQGRFVADLFTTGGRMFLTGDLGRTRADGTIEFVGRADRQVQVRGRRVEPAEVEAALGRNPAVRACAVVPATRDGGPTSLDAYVVAEGPAGPSATDLRRSLLVELPAAMVPARFFAVDELPRATSGKVDRAALASRPARRLGTSRPRRRLTDTEAAVVDAYAHLLGAAEVGVDDDFFDRGGDSLLAVELVARLGDRLGCLPDVRDVFEAPTPADLAERLDVAHAPTLPPVTRRPQRSGQALPASPLQTGVLEAPGVPAGHPVQNRALAVRIRGRLDVDRAADAARAVVRRHGALRTALCRDGDRWLQHDVPDATCTVATLAVAGDDGLSSALRHAAEQAFDLGRPPLFRMSVFELAGDDHVLSFVTHRAVADDWSLHLLLRDWSRAYFHLVDGCAAPPPLAYDHADHCAWFDAASASGSAAPHLTHWAALLDDRPPDVMFAEPVGARPDRFRATVVRRDVDGRVALGLAVLARRAAVPLRTVLMVGFHRFLARHAGRDDVVFGVPDSGRRGLPQFEGVVGVFERTLPMRLAPARGAGGRDGGDGGGDGPGPAAVPALLGEAQRAVAAARRAHFLPAEAYGPARPSVVVTHATPPALQPGTVTLDLVDVDDAHTDVALHVATSESGARLRARLQFGGPVSLARAEGLADDYLAALADLVGAAGEG